ncbi:uncharacterized protein [Miscanthus floridulus]|uniref:uncharacterized protein isoform X2 n=1 Tax=Miscanthus floridulus TaxID=154761 RepID=UPI00345A180F
MDSEASMLDHIEHMLLDESAEPSDMPLSFLRAITNNFSDEQKIGIGGFAEVYEGRLRNGRSVAVKKFSDMILLNDERIYIKELESMIRLKHKNIVRFFGYCADSQWKMVKHGGRHVLAEIRQRLLCFEFVPLGSLDKYISDMSEGLEWRKRYQIIRGICEGLHYLHEENVLHLDLKPSNILLDYNLVPKITDFGLSRCFDDKQTRTFTHNVNGSMGYMAPESSSGVITFKSDVYSLGIIITEMLTGRKGYCQIEYVLESWKTRLKMPMGDTLEQIRVCVEIGIMCIDSNPDNRPDLRHIIRVLNEMESMYVVTETTTSSSLVTQGSDEHVSEDTNVAAITDEKQQKVSLLSTLPKNLPFQFLEEITDGFSKEREVGRGGFGVVYKGLLVDGHSIAVRRLLRFQGIQMKHFANEVNILMELRHKNIVNLLGYCHEDRQTRVEYQGKLVWAETSEQLLCYEYLDYGSIDKYIFDADMEPRITDFGLSRLVAEDNTGNVKTRMLGPIGYMAPEYSIGVVTRKADIFSLGILILEIVTGQDNSTKVDFIEHVCENCTDEWIASMYCYLDADSLQLVKVCIEIGLECVQTDRTKRPTAGDIIRKLEGGNKLGPTPSRKNTTTEIGMPQLFSFKFLNDITQSFSSGRLRGEGGFGFVYEGIPHGNMGAMAVKRLKEKIGISPKQFENEVQNLSRIQHRNIVRLIGYCDEIREILSHGKNKDDPPVREDIQERLLCYEYMPEGSLEKIIYDKLNWHMRYKIIEGICEGLHCLHEGQKDIQIVHLDLKPANILLGSDMVPKLADFGLSRFFNLEQVYIIASKATGTPGYIAPEYLEHKKVSTKADIYSFGIIVLEIVTGKVCPHSYNADINAQHFINHLRQNLTKDDDIKSMYGPDLEADCLQQVKLCIKIGLNCMEKDPTKRPTAGEIISMLKQKRDSNRSGLSNCIVNVIEAWISRLPWHPWPLTLQ